MNYELKTTKQDYHFFRNLRTQSPINQSPNMKIALIGYGKMGREIETIALSNSHEIVLRIGSANQNDLTPANLEQADVAIEFSRPDVAVANLLFCIENKIPVVCGTTGWYQQLPEIEAYCRTHNGTLLTASNFSIGVNIFFEINKLLAKLVHTQPEYDITIKEIHHTTKKDAPSGTAITLAEQILKEVKRKTKWVNQHAAIPTELAITSERTDPAPGTHIITCNGPADSIEITHTAHNRAGFALGAVLAAEYIYNKKGVFSMQEVLGLYPAEK
jgi:4-hydroxy-tetrahydrodipicolinate reductase